MRVRQSFDPAVLRIAGEFIWRTFLIGLVLFRDATFRDCAERGATRCCIYRCRRLVLLRRLICLRKLAAGSAGRRDWFFWGTKWTQALLFFSALRRGLKGIREPGSADIVHPSARPRSASRFPYLTRVGAITPVQET